MWFYGSVGKKSRNKDGLLYKPKCLNKCGAMTSRADGICSACFKSGVTVYTLLANLEEVFSDEWEAREKRDVSHQKEARSH